MAKISSVGTSVGDREKLRPAKILTFKMQFMEPVIEGTNWLVDDVHDEIH